MIDLVDASYLTGKEHYLEDVNHPLPGQIKAVRSAGYSRFYVYENSLREMGGEVARQALMKTGLDASDIDFIVAAHTRSLFSCWGNGVRLVVGRTLSSVSR